MKPPGAGCYSIKEMMRMMTREVDSVSELVSDNEALNLIFEIKGADRIYVTGAGRSGIIARAFAMRLMHLGFESYVVGETITPAMKPGDTLIVFSGSGETHSVAKYALAARSAGGRICIVTANRTSTIAEMADCVVVLQTGNHSENDNSNKFEIRQLTGDYRSLSMSFALLGSLFETSLLIFSDALISGIIEMDHCNIIDLRDRAANIQ